MNKADYLRLALINKNYIYKDWIVRALTFVRSDPLHKYNIPYNIVQTNDGFYYNDDVVQKLVKITDANPNEPLFKVNELVIIDNEICPNVTEKREAPFGNVLLNLICLVSSFGKKIPYMENFTVPKVEKIIALRLKDLPEDTSKKNETDIYPDELNLFNDTLEYLKGLTPIVSQVNSERTITPPPGIIEIRNELIKKYGDKLKDPVELTNFESELKKVDNDYLEDDPANKFVDGKMRNISRKRLYLTFGYEAGFNDTGEARPIAKSLSEGWDLDKMPDMINNLRLGSYGRGAETQLGGEMTKWLLRTLNGVKVKKEDCGTRLGMRMLVTEENVHRLVNLYIVGKDKPILIENDEQSRKLIGKQIILRQPQFCKESDGLSYCKTCMGKTLGENPRIIPSAGATYGSTLMMVSMKKMHGVALETTPIDFQTYLT